MEVSFPALIKKLTLKSLSSGDKGGELVLYFRPDNEMLGKLSELHRADQEVMIGIVSIPEKG